MVVVYARGLMSMGMEEGEARGAARPEPCLLGGALEIGFVVVEGAASEALEVVQGPAILMNAVAQACDAVDESISKPVDDRLRVRPEVVLQAWVSGAEGDDGRIASLNEERDRGQLWAFAQHFWVEHHGSPAKLSACRTA